ncbi:MAG: InlB B-repeat-containing protein [Lachnospiraceae bacterium]
MKKKSIFQKLAVGLSITLVSGSVVPGLPFQISVSAGEKTETAYQTIVRSQNGNFSNLQNPKQPEQMETWSGSYLQFGAYAQEADGTKKPIRWRLLDTASDSDGDGTKDSYLVLSDQILDRVPFNETTEQKNEWQDSHVQKWLNETFRKTFSTQEQAAVAETTKPEGAAVEYLNSPPLTGESFFLLSAEEAQKPEYGFWNSQGTAKANTSHALKVTEYAKKQGVAETDGYGDWWLRSKSEEGTPLAGIVDHEGWLFDDTVTDDAVGVAPVCNLKTESIAFLLADEVKKGAFQAMKTEEKEPDIWDVTLQASDQNLQAKAETEDGTITSKDAKKGISISHKAARSVLPQATQISAMLLDTDGNILYYGKIAEDCQAETTAWSIPEELSEGTYQLYVFAEQIAEGSDTVCDLGEPIPVTVTKQETPQEPSEEPSVSEEPTNEESTNEPTNPTESSKAESSESSEEETTLPPSSGSTSTASEPALPGDTSKPTEPGTSRPTQPSASSSSENPTNPTVPSKPSASTQPTQPQKPTIPSEESEPTVPQEGSNQTVTYHLVVEDGIGSGMYQAGETVTIRADEAKKGYQFAKWTVSGVTLDDALSSETTLRMPENMAVVIANYEPIRYKISYALDGGTLQKQNPSVYTIETESFLLNNPTKSGYTFLGWTWEDQKTPQKTVQIPKGSTGDCAFTANWEKKEAASGSQEPSESPSTAPSEPSQQPSQEKTYTLTYQKNTTKSVSNFVSGKKQYKEGSRVTISQAPICNSLFFDSWNTKADGSGQKITPGKKVVLKKNVTLYAQWKKNVTVSGLKYCVNGKKIVSCTGTSDKKKTSCKVPTVLTYAGIRYQVTEIAPKAFYKNKKLTTVSIGDSVKTIRANAFYQCTSLKKVTIGTGLTTIESQAFGTNKKGCTIVIKSTRLKTVRGIQNKGTEKLTLQVPAKKKNAYKKLFQATLKKNHAKLS